MIGTAACMRLEVARHLILSYNHHHSFRTSALNLLTSESFMDLPSPAQSPSRSFRSPYRRRRVIWFALFFTVAGLFFLAPDSFWEVSHGHELAAAGKEWMKPIIGGSGSGQQPYARDEELKDLLHMVASSELTIPKTADPSNPLPKDTYKADLEGVKWLQEAQADPPIIVFSKVLVIASFAFVSIYLKTLFFS